MRAILLIGVICVSAALAQQPGYLELLDQAKTFEKKGDMARAYLAYSQAAVLAPGDNKVWAKSLALRRRATMEAGVLPEGDDESGTAYEYEPETITEKELAEARRLLPPIALQPPDPAKRRVVDLKGNSREVWEQFAKAYGIDVVFDGDYQGVTGVSVRLDATNYDEALMAVEHATASFLIPASERLGLVARDTQPKRQELQHNVAIAIPLPAPVTPQEAQELARTVQQVMELQKFTVDSRVRMALMRGPLHKVLPARQLFEQLMNYKPDVGIEIRFLESNRNAEYNYGLRLQTQFPMGWLSSILNSKAAIPSGVQNLATFGGGMTFFGVGLMGAELFANFTTSDATTLLTSQIRSTSGQPATFHIGDRYPVITAGYFGDVGPVDPGTPVFTPPPTFNFEELGILLKLTPWVHDRDEISIAVEAEFKVLTGETTNGIPVIANRKFVTQVRLKEGEWAVLSGLVTAFEARSFTGLAGLAQVPYLGRLFRENSQSKQNREALIAIRPVLLSDPPSETVTKAIWTGTETKPRAGM